MLYHILNDNDMCTPDPEIALNEEYYSKTYDDSDIFKINVIKSNIQSFISDFDIEEYEINKDKNNVINISKFKKVLSNEEVERICDEYVLSCHILYNNIDQETNYLSTYENEWPGSITNLVNIEYNIELGMLNFPLNLLQVNYSYKIFQLTFIQLLKIDENIDDIAIHKYYDMMKNTRIITNANFELLSSKKIIVNHGKYTLLNYFQFKTFNVWKHNYISK